MPYDKSLTCQTSSIELTAQTDALTHLWNDNSTNQKLDTATNVETIPYLLPEIMDKTSKSLTITSTPRMICQFLETITNVTR